MSHPEGGDGITTGHGTPVAVEFDEVCSKSLCPPLDTAFQFLRNWPGTSLAGTWKIFLQGGAVSAVNPADTAFIHRQALMISSIEIEWEASDSPAKVAQNQTWLDQFHQAMAPFTSTQCYQNFIDDSQTDYLRAYYGTNLERLVTVKNHYDPRNIFSYPQSIPLRLS